jgi:phage major head subunit gpT-like protein
MIVDAASLTDIRNSVNTRFQAGITGGPAPWYGRLAMTIPSATRTNTYAFMDKLPKFREWVGERVVNHLVSRAYAITNRKWEHTLGIPRDDIEDDQYGLYGAYAEMAGQQARKHPDDLVLDVLLNGKTKLCHDGQYFFDTDHPVNIDDPSAGVQANLITAKPLGTDGNLEAVRAQMQLFKGADGRVLGINPRLLIVPPQLETTAKKLVVAEQGANGATNVNKGTAEVLVIPELGAEPTTWYLADVAMPIKPFVFQERQAVEWVEKFDLSDDNVFKQDEFLFGGRMRNAAGYGFYWLIARVEAT